MSILNLKIIFRGDSGQETVEICQRTVNPHNKVNCENFKIQRVVGRGGYGKVCDIIRKYN